MKSIKLLFSGTITILFLIFSTGISFSQTQPDSDAKTNDLNKIQFIGADDDYLVFDLRFFVLPARGCTLRIIDDAGNTMFEEAVSGSSYSKRYKIVREGMKRLSFKAIGKGFSFYQAFTIRTEEKIIVTSE